LRAAVDNLVSNWAYLVMTDLAWNLKAWFALSVPEHPRYISVHREQKRQLVRMVFKRFVVILMPWRTSADRPIAIVERVARGLPARGSLTSVLSERPKRGSGCLGPPRHREPQCR
jgi:hypothetical protein